MVKKLSKKSRSIFSGRTDGDGDLKPKSALTNVNPPPLDPDDCCQCCGRHISELKPFDPLPDEFDGPPLIKVYIPAYPYDEEAQLAYDEAEYHCKKVEDILDWLKKRHGEKKGEQIYYIVPMFHSVVSIRLCRDCAALDEDEFYKRLYNKS